MRLMTHISFGLLAGALCYYLFNLDVSFILLTGFAAFLPDIDWAMQFKWGLGKRHRTFGHNVWFVLAIATLSLALSGSIVVFAGVLIGMVTHLLADSLTVTGVIWLYPIKQNIHTKGPLNMSNESEKKVERVLQSILLSFAGFLFLAKNMRVEDPFSFNGTITLVIIFGVGYAIMKKFNQIIKKTIRSFRI